MIAYRGVDPPSPVLRVYVAAADGSALRDYTPAGASADWPTWSPDGNKVAFAAQIPDQGWQIVLADVRTGQAKPLTTAGDDLMPVWRRH